MILGVSAGQFLLEVDGRIVVLDVALETAREIPAGIDRASVVGRQGWRDPNEVELGLAEGLEALARSLI